MNGFIEPWVTSCSDAVGNRCISVVLHFIHNRVTTIYWLYCSIHVGWWYLCPASSFYVHISCSSGQQVSAKTETNIWMTWSETVLYSLFLTFWMVWTILFTAQTCCTLSHHSESAIGWTSKESGFCCWQGEKTLPSPKHPCWPWDQGPTQHSVQ